jgi:16S rRNA G1207 methylase RsmC
MTTLQALKILKTEFEDLKTSQKDGSLKSLMQLEDVLIQIVKELKPEVRRFVNAQKRKDIRTVEQMYIENLRKEKRKPFKKVFKSV